MKIFGAHPQTFSFLYHLINTKLFDYSKKIANNPARILCLNLDDNVFILIKKYFSKSIVRNLQLSSLENSRLPRSTSSFDLFLANLAISNQSFDISILLEDVQEILSEKDQFIFATLDLQSKGLLTQYAHWINQEIIDEEQVINKLEDIADIEVVSIKERLLQNEINSIDCHIFVVTPEERLENQLYPEFEEISVNEISMQPINQSEEITIVKEEGNETLYSSEFENQIDSKETDKVIIADSDELPFSLSDLENESESIILVEHENELISDEVPPRDSMNDKVELQTEEPVDYKPIDENIEKNDIETNFHRSEKIEISDETNAQEQTDSMGNSEVINEKYQIILDDDFQIEKNENELGIEYSNEDSSRELVEIIQSDYLDNKILNENDNNEIENTVSTDGDKLTEPRSFDVADVEDKHFESSDSLRVDIENDDVDLSEESVNKEFQEEESIEDSWFEEESIEDGWSEEESAEYGWSEEESVEDGWSEEESVEDGWSEEESVEDGWSEEEFVEDGWSEEEFVEDGWSEEEFVEDGWSEEEFVEDGWSEEEFVEDGWSEEESVEDELSEEEFVENDCLEGESIEDNLSEEGVGSDENSSSKNLEPTHLDAIDETSSKIDDDRKSEIDSDIIEEDSETDTQADGSDEFEESDAEELLIEKNLIFREPDQTEEKLEQVEFENSYNVLFVKKKKINIGKNAEIDESSDDDLNVEIKKRSKLY